MPTFWSLFSGIGGLDRGLELAGWKCEAQVEKDEWCQRVLTKHWPLVPKFGDVREFSGEGLATPDLICGGFPCQGASHAGRGRGVQDPRWLWPEFARIIRLVRPRFVLVENVPGLTHPGRGMSEVLGDLAAGGYDAEWDCIPAAAFGAPHLRYRIWIVAYRQSDTQRPYTNGERSHRAQIHEFGNSEFRDQQDGEPRSVGTPLAYAGSPRLEGPRAFGAAPQRSEWGAEPNVGRVASRTPDGVDRLRGLGNAVVPQVAEWIGRRLMEVA